MAICGSAAPSALAQQGFPSGSIPTVDDTARSRILAALASGRPVDALKEYFGPVYDSLRPTWVIYLGADSAKQWLVKHNKPVTSRVLDGEKNLFVRVFAPGIPAAARGASSPPSVEAFVTLTRTTLDYKADPALIRLVAAAGSILKINPVGSETETATSGTAVDTLHLIDVGRTTPFYAAWGRMPLKENTQYQLAIAPQRGRWFGTDQIVITNIGNKSRSRFGAALAGGLTLQADVQRAADTGTARGHSERIDLYVFGQWFLRRPELPWSKRSRALVLGTNVLDGNILDDIVIGHSWGRHFGALGLVLGINLLEGVKPNGSETRFVRPFVGLDYLF